MARAAKACSTPSCPHLEPCPDHPKQAWSGSRRRERLRSGSGHRQQKLRSFVLHRDGHRCHVCHEVYEPGQLVNDHIVPVGEGGEDHVDNMGPCCTGPGTNGCHETKSKEEAKRGRDRAA